MSNFGLSPDQIKLIKNAIQSVFGPDKDLRVYIFGSRATGKNRKFSDIDLAFKSKDKEINKKISLLKNKLEESSLPYKFDLINWNEILQAYMPQIKKEKKVFWSEKDIIITSPWRLCPVGYHWVKEHLKSGNKDSTDPHCRRNPSGKDILKSDEIIKISELEIFKNPPVKASSNDMGFRGKDKKYDYYINGWCAYWNETLKPDLKIDPNIVKALIATESSFEENPKRTAGRTAIGITQLMPKTITYLSSRSKELKDHYVEISKKDAFDPNVNIAASIRWIFRKYEIIKRKKDITWFDVIEEYKGIRNQRGPVSNRIRDRFKEEYLKLVPDGNL
ncbi:MAG: transglycosylase SLT domain-containing protein [Bacteriovoracia bacterium]